MNNFEKYEDFEISLEDPHPMAQMQNCKSS